MRIHGFYLFYETAFVSYTINLLRPVLLRKCGGASAKTSLLESTWKHLLHSASVVTLRASVKRPTMEEWGSSSSQATPLHNSQAARVSSGRLITHSPPNLSRMQMWLLTCNAIVELPHNALCIYNAPLREFADLIGTLLHITSCMGPPPQPPAACSRTAPPLP